jgi:hypothetical protein
VANPTIEQTVNMRLLSAMLLPMAVRLHQRLDNDSTKRVHKLLGWEHGTWSSKGREAIAKHFQTLDPTEFNRFVVAACIADELHYAQYWHPGTEGMDAVGQVLGVDPKQIRANLVAAAKAEEKQKAAGKKAMAKAVEQIKGKAAPTEQWRKLTTEAEGRTLKAGDRVKVRDDAEARLSKGMKPYAGRTGSLHSQCGPLAWWLDLDKAQGKSATRTLASAHFTELLRADAADDAATAPAAQAPITTKAAAKPAAKKKAKAEEQLSLAIPDPDKPPAYNAWPFPMNGETTAQAKDRADKASKAMKAAQGQAAAVEGAQ